MCCNKCGSGPGFISRQVTGGLGERELARHDRKIREETIRGLLGQAAPAQTPTEYGQKVLITVGAIVLLAGMNVILHVLLIALGSVVAAVAGLGAVVAVRRSRRRRRPGGPAPPPRPELAEQHRATVTGVTVRAVSPAPRHPLPWVPAGQEADHHDR